MDYLLEDLLRVRQHRENAAGIQVRTKAHALENAIGDEKRRQAELAEYTAWRTKTEDSLYERVKNQQISLQKLDDLKQHVLLLREKETFLEKELFEARNARQAAEDQLREARAAYQAAFREMKKIQEHKHIWMTDMLKEQERSREKELEDFHATPPALEEEFENDEDY